MHHADPSRWNVAEGSALIDRNLARVLEVFLKRHASILALRACAVSVLVSYVLVRQRSGPLRQPACGRLPSRAHAPGRLCGDLLSGLGLKLIAGSNPPPRATVAKLRRPALKKPGQRSTHDVGERVAARRVGDNAADRVLQRDAAGPDPRLVVHVHHLAERRSPVRTAESAAVAWLTPAEVRDRMNEAFAVRILDALDPMARQPVVRTHDGTHLIGPTGPAHHPPGPVGPVPLLATRTSGHATWRHEDLYDDNGRWSDSAHTNVDRSQPTGTSGNAARTFPRERS